jgi:hypothetical protein
VPIHLCYIRLGYKRCFWLHDPAGVFEGLKERVKNSKEAPTGGPPRREAGIHEGGDDEQ